MSRKQHHQQTNNHDPELEYMWINVYRNPTTQTFYTGTYTYPSRAEAKAAASQPHVTGEYLTSVKVWREKPKRDVWVNMFRRPNGTFVIGYEKFNTKTAAVNHAHSGLNAGYWKKHGYSHLYAFKLSE